MFADNAVSIEPPGSPGLQSVEGMAAIKEKGRTAPVVGGNFFIVGMGMDCKMKGMACQKMDEIALYEVRDGKIVREQFFY